MSIFRCKVCEQKDLRIEELKAQIKFLQSMLQPNPAAQAINWEANKMLEGGSLPAVELEGVTTVNMEQRKHEDAVVREQNRILTGDYAEVE